MAYLTMVYFLPIPQNRTTSFPHFHSIRDRNSNICAGISGSRTSFPADAGTFSILVIFRTVFRDISSCLLLFNSSRTVVRSISSSRKVWASCKIARTRYAFFCPSGTVFRISQALRCSGFSRFGRKEKVGRFTVPSSAQRSVHILRHWHAHRSERLPGTARPPALHGVP